MIIGSIWSLGWRVVHHGYSLTSSTPSLCLAVIGVITGTFNLVHTELVLGIEEVCTYMNFSDQPLSYERRTPI